MSEHIKHSTADIWNERFRDRMIDLGLSQRAFIKKYKEKYGTGSQSDVSNWLHVGEVYGKKKQIRNFPDFKTMLRIANILEVSVSYLIGETDYSSFEMERASKLIGISEQSLLALKNITSGKSIPPFYNHPDQDINMTLEAMLVSPILLDYLKAIYMVKKSEQKKNNLENYFKEACDNIPESIRDDVFSLFEDPIGAVEDQVIIPTDEIWNYVKTLDDALDKESAQPYIMDQEINANKYAASEMHANLLESLKVNYNFL